MVFLLVSTSATFGLEDPFTGLVEDLTCADVAIAFSAVNVLANRIPALRHVSTMAVHFMTIGIRKLDQVMIVNLAMIDACSHQASPLPLCRNWIGDTSRLSTFVRKIIPERPLSK